MVALGNAAVAVFFTPQSTANLVESSVLSGGNSISAEDQGTNNTIRSCLVGLAADGRSSLPNRNGILVSPHSRHFRILNCTVAGITGQESTDPAISVSGSNTLCEGLRVGCDITGTVPIPNAAGIQVQAVAVSATIRDCFVVASIRDGIGLFSGPHRVESCVVGTEGPGMGNSNGIALYHNSFVPNGTIITQTTVNATIVENCVVVGNRRRGIVITGRNNVVRNNTIRRNRNDGLYFLGGSSNIADSNFISSNELTGIVLADVQAPVVTGTTSCIGNGGDGITVLARASGVRIDGVVAAGNNGNGILVLGRDVRIANAQIGMLPAQASANTQPAIQQWIAAPNRLNGIRLGSAAADVIVSDTTIGAAEINGVLVEGRNATVVNNRIGFAEVLRNSSSTSGAPTPLIRGSGLYVATHSPSIFYENNTHCCAMVDLFDVRFTPAPTMPPTSSTPLPTTTPTPAPTGSGSAGAGGGTQGSGTGGSSAALVAAGISVAVVVAAAVVVGMVVVRHRRNTKARTQLLGELTALLSIPNLHAQEQYASKFAGTLGVVSDLERRLDALALGPDRIHVDTSDDGSHVLGSGVHGRVLRAHLMAGGGRAAQAAQQQQQVAVKMLHEGTFSGAECVSLLLEARVMAMLPEHDHVIRLVGLHIRQAPVMIVLPYFELGNLKRFLQQRAAAVAEDHLSPVDLDQLRAAMPLWAEQISQACEFLHRHMLIHRDLAARNVLVRGQKVRQGVRGECHFYVEHRGSDRLSRNVD